MSVRLPDTLVCCSFMDNKLPDPQEEFPVAEVYFAKTKDFRSGHSVLWDFINDADRKKADNLHFEEDRDTYLSCHTLLRLVLSAKLNIDPQDVPFVYDKNNKPGLEGNPLFFNISHSRDAFAFVVSENLRVGIDIEKIDRNVDYLSISRRFFCEQENKIVLSSETDSRDNFFLFWTRKEAVLKALGTGIISDISRVEVCRQHNVLDKHLFDKILDDSLLGDYFIYSKKISGFYLSIAASQKAEIKIYQPEVVKAIPETYLLSFVRSFI
jgi:phosphopantetheine--protein transferase-like protein